MAEVKLKRIYKIDYDELLGKKLWVCDYRHRNIYQKPLRHIPPTQVVIESYHMAKVGSKKYIKLFDEANPMGFLKAFTTKKECYECYNNMCKKVLSEVEKAIDSLREYKSVVTERGGYNG